MKLEHPKLIHKNFLQAKLTIGQPGDKYEKEADAMADQVIRMKGLDEPVQRKCADCEEDVQMKPLSDTISPIIQKQEEEEEMLQMKTSDTYNEVGINLSSKLSQTKGSGSKLPKDTGEKMNRAFGADFGQVNIHTGTEAVQMSQDLGARAFTHGTDIYFNEGEYNPESQKGQHLLAHELTHVVQQKHDTIQRAISPEDLPTTRVNTIMSDPTYFENNISRIQFFSAELAILHYADGTSIRVGLVPDQLDSSVPISGVDYITPSSAHMRVNRNPEGNLTYIPRGHEMQVDPHITFRDFMRESVQSISFSHDPGSGRIVPSVLNSLTAPRLCEVLLAARQAYARNMDAYAQGAIEVLERLEWIVVLASLVPSGGGSAVVSGGTRAGTRGAAVRGATAVGTSVTSRAIAALTSRFSRLLSSGGTEAMILVEGVEFHSVRVAMEGTELVITRLGIRNASRIPAQGRLVHAAYEQAAIAAARQAGARTVSVRMETVVNQSWRSYLESQGYVMQLIETSSGFSNKLVRVFTL